MLGRLEEPLSIREYRYIGLGGMWFSDFILMHRVLGLREMVSIEKVHANRAAFNRPFECIRVEEGDSSCVLPDLDLEKGPAVIWLDYDSDISGPALDDIEIMTRTGAESSICIVTVNADIRTVRKQKGPDGELLTEGEAFRRYARGFVPVGMAEGKIQGSAFPGMVAQVLLNAFSHGVSVTGRGMTFQPLLNVGYRDGAAMITVGGVFLGRGRSELDLEEHGPLPFWPPSVTDPFWIRVPNLTMREKAALDQMMPGEGPPSITCVRSTLGFELSQEKLSAYHLFYRHYPTFAEYDV